LKDIPTVIKLAFDNLRKKRGPVFSKGGDRDSLTLRREDEELIKSVVSENPNTIVAVMGGSTIIMEEWRHLVPAIVMVWYPGMEGGHAFADILFGKISPGGKLPFVIPTDSRHLPFFDKDATQIKYDLWHGYRILLRDGHEPAFPFGFGLSYTTFGYRNLVIEQDQLAREDVLKAELDISNTGQYAGEEVMQLYVSVRGSKLERAPRELKAFSKIMLQAGETGRIRFEVPVAQLAYYDEQQEQFVVESAEYEVFVGAHSLDANGLKVRFTVQ
jgi:beta-glucosidase